jgi:hypothetical protein
MLIFNLSRDSHGDMFKTVMLLELKKSLKEGGSPRGPYNAPKSKDNRRTFKKAMRLDMPTFWRLVQAVR